MRIGGRPAVFLDVERRAFYLFGATFNAQDTGLVFFLVTGVAFGLVVVTALAGRVWCGWACPQTVFLESLYRPIERLIEGPREARIRRASAPWTANGLLRKLLTHGAYVLISLALAHVLVSYFVSLPRLYAMVRAAPAAHPQAFAWTFALTAALYANFAHFREQLCLGVCPYGRLQGALTDADSLVIGYDARRGEPRGKAVQAGHGDCVDCHRCVVVCPTGIDIRRGLQLDCIGCTACIDACDEIMDRLSRPRGLIRYDSLAGLEGRPRRLVRPRVVAYAALGLAGAFAAALALRAHTDFEANLLRLPGAPYTLEADEVRNAFQVHLVNKRGATTTLQLEPLPPPGVRVIAPLRAVTLGPLESASAPVFVSVDRAAFRGEFTLPIRVRAQGDPPSAGVTIAAPFLGPATGISRR
jgi:cytochrome c oxidase accessory protein FixG